MLCDNPVAVRVASQCYTAGQADPSGRSGVAASHCEFLCNAREKQDRYPGPAPPTVGNATGPVADSLDRVPRRGATLLGVGPGRGIGSMRLSY
jgi:hypothetical protein